MTVSATTADERVRVGLCGQRVRPTHQVNAFAQPRIQHEVNVESTELSDDLHLRKSKQAQSPPPTDTRNRITT